MKFAIAAGILAQTLPVVADGSAGLLANAKQLKLQLQDALLQDHAGQQDPDQPSLRLQVIKASRTKKRSQRFPTGELKNNPADVVAFFSTPDLAFEMEYCDPAPEDPDVGVLSCGTGRVCKASQKSLLGGVCAERTTKKKSTGGKNKNKAKKGGKSHLSFKTLKAGAASFSARPSIVDTKACNPISDDPDVGLLSCGPDSFCESRPASVLGGLCVAPGPSSRALQLELQGRCDPESDYYEAECDCSGYDISTGIGDVVCTYPFCLDDSFISPDLTGSWCSDDCCYETCGNLVVTWNYSTMSYQACYDFSTPYPQELCIGLSDASSGYECYSTFDDQDCLCEIGDYYDGYYPVVVDCSAVGGFVLRGADALLSIPIIESCYQYFPGSTIPGADPPGIGSTIPPGAAGSDSAIPTVAPGGGTSMSPTSPSPAMIDSAVPTTDAPSDAPDGAPDGADGGLSKQAVASFLGTTTALALFFLS